MKRMVIGIMILLLVLTGSAVLFAQGQAESMCRSRWDLQFSSRV